MAKDLAIVLNNGSVNSAVLTALAAQKHRPILVYADVGSSDAPSRRRTCYDQQVAHFKPFREHTIAMPFLNIARDKAGNAGLLADNRAAAAVTPALRDLATLLGAAVTFATAYEVSAIYCGLSVGPSNDDLSQATEFFQIWNEMLQLTLACPELEVHAPLLELERWQVVDLGFQVNAPLDRTWSCTEDQGDPCWSCRGCKLREAAFMQAAKPDPIRPVRKV